MIYFKQKELQKFNPMIDKISKDLSLLDQIVKDKPHFSYNIRDINLYLEKEPRVNAYISLNCDLNQRMVCGRDNFSILFNPDHNYLNIDATKSEANKTLEAQERINCSSEEIADKIEEIFKYISESNIDYIFRMVGDRLKFDRKKNSFRGWTGGYFSNEPDIGILKEMNDKNKEWHKKKYISNLEMRLDSLYFLSDYIAEKINEQTEDNDYKFVPQIPQKPKARNGKQLLKQRLSKIDPKKHKNLGKIKDFIEKQRNIESTLIMNCSGHYSIRTNEMHDLQQIQRPIYSFEIMPDSDKFRILHSEIIKPSSERNKKIIEGFEQMDQSVYRKTENGLSLTIDGSMTKDGSPIMWIEREDIKNYSYDEFIRDYDYIKNIKKRLAKGQKI